MTAKENKLASEMLDLAASEFSNHGCNEVDEALFKDWTLEERQQFVKEFHDYNGDPENFDPEFLYLGDSTIMSYLSHKLNQ